MTHSRLKYSCPICNMFFWDMEKKGKHIASFKHKLLRPRPPPSSFKCESCDRVLKSGNSLRTHRIEMHMNRDYSGLECYLCKLQIKTKIGLTHHMSRSHVARRPGNRDYLQCNGPQLSFGRTGVMTLRVVCCCLQPLLLQPTARGTPYVIYAAKRITQSTS